MPDISSVGHFGQVPVGPLDRVSSPSPVRRSDAGHSNLGSSLVEPAPLHRAPERPGDSLDLSEHARYLDQIRRLPSARLDRVDQVRAEIARGDYETEEKLHETIDRLLDDLSD